MTISPVSMCPILRLTSLKKKLLRGPKSDCMSSWTNISANFPGTKTAVVAGDAAEKIIEYIEDQNIDLVIMGTHGRKGMDKIIFGSVAERVVKTSPVPVMVVNPYK